MSTPLQASKQSSVFLANLHHAYARTDGTYAFPNSREGDLLKQAKREIEALQAGGLIHAHAMASVHALIKEGDTQAAIDHARRALGLPVS